MQSSERGEIIINKKKLTKSIRLSSLGFFSIPTLKSSCSCPFHLVMQKQQHRDRADKHKRMNEDGDSDESECRNPVTGTAVCPLAAVSRFERTEQDKTCQTTYREQLFVTVPSNL